MLRLWCRNCNECIDVPEDCTTVFCPRCRTKIDVASRGINSDETKPEPQVVAQPEIPVQNSPKKSKKGLIIAISAAALAIILSVVLVLVLKPASKHLIPYWDETAKAYGYCTENGKVVIEPKFDGARIFEEELAQVWVDGKWGFINKQGEFVIEPQFGIAFTFSENGLAQFWVDGKYGYINTKGEIVSEPQFDDAKPFENGFAAVEVDGKWGYINEKGEFVIEPQFGGAGSFENGLALVWVDGISYCINTKGEIIRPKQ